MLQWEEKQVLIQRRRHPERGCTRPKRMWKWRRWMVCRVRKIVQGGVRPKRQEKRLMKKRKVNKDIQRRRMEEKMRREEKRSLKREI
ncbi:Tyrosine-protein phosphatase non-receptor type 13 [Dissostichus eleginoides]|uniref:Tyrosine-protein phosphatase non-receptor type 13 n=1 Tax=Dissostichus eleginoides TaxID=100907 RepID=A0AAD9ERZ8_DISEL|nr:Tyrosine-protein phosphatase non-receptor type 13 [Dissostichus eleginoides]